MSDQDIASKDAYQTIAILRMAANICDLLSSEPKDGRAHEYGDEIAEGLSYVLADAADTVGRLKIYIDDRNADNAGESAAGAR